MILKSFSLPITKQNLCKLPCMVCIEKCMFLFAVSLIGVDVGYTSTRISRFANYLRNLLPSNDVAVMEMAARAVGRLALSSGTYTAEYVEFEVKRSFEWLTGDRQEGKRHAAVSVHFIHCFLLSFPDRCYLEVSFYIG